MILFSFLGLCTSLSGLATAAPAAAPARDPGPRGTLLARVVTASGEPLRDVEVEVIRIHGIAALAMRGLFTGGSAPGAWKWRLSPALLTLGSKPGPEDRHATRTDAQGRFSLAKLPAGAYRVLAHPQGLPLAWALVQVSESGSELEVVATPPLTLHGRTFQGDGRVAPRITLEIVTMEGKRAPVVSGPDGRFEVRDLPRGPIDVLPRQKSFEPLIQHLFPSGSSRRSPARMRVMKEHPLSGRVLRGGRGVAGALIEASLPEALPSKAQGRFTLKNYSGTRLRATTDGASSMLLDPARPQDLPRPLRLELQPHGRAALVVVDGEGLPVRDVVVEASVFGQREPARATSNGEGVAFFSDLRPDAYRATAMEGPWRSSQFGEKFSVTPGALTRARLKVFRTAPLTVRVVDTEGHLLEKAQGQVLLRTSEGSFSRRIEGGMVRYDAVPRGEASLRLSIAGARRERPRKIMVGDEASVDLPAQIEKTPEKEVKAQSSASRPLLRGTVHAPGGLALPGVMLQLRAAPLKNDTRPARPFTTRSVFGRAHTSLLQTRTDPRGAFTFEGVPPGRFELKIQASAWTLKQPIFVDGPSAPLKIEALRAATLAGRLLDARGRPVRPTPVKARDAEGRLLAETRSDVWGFFTLSGLTPGRYTFSAEGGDRTVKKAVTLPIGGARITLRYPRASATLLLRVQRGRVAVPFFSVSLGSFRAQGLRGRLRLEDLEPGEQKLQIKVPGQAPIRLPLIFRAGKVLKKTIHLPASPPTPLVLTVIDTEGRPLPGVKVGAAGVGRGARRQSDAFGEVSLPGLKAGKTTLELRDANPGVARIDLLLKTGKGQRFTVTLPAGTVVPGRKVDPSALPPFVILKLGEDAVRGAELTLSPDAPQQEVVSDDQGRVLLASARPQALKVRLCGDDAPVRIRRPGKKDGSVAWLALDLPPETAKALREGRCRASLAK